MGLRAGVGGGPWAPISGGFWGGRKGGEGASLAGAGGQVGPAVGCGAFGR